VRALHRINSQPKNPALHIVVAVLIKLNIDANYCKLSAYKQNPSWLAASHLRHPIRPGKLAANGDVFMQCRPRLRGQHINSY
jgi:hypothetical protein